MSVARNLLLTGGIVHPFETAAAALAGVLRGHGIESVVTMDIEGGLAEVPRGGFDLLTIFSLRWTTWAWSSPTIRSCAALETSP